MHGQVGGDDRRDTGDTEGGGCVCADRSGVSRGAGATDGEDAGGGVVVTTEGYRGLFGEGGEAVLLDGEESRSGDRRRGG